MPTFFAIHAKTRKFTLHKKLSTMKKIFYIFSLAIAALSLVACNNDDEQVEVATYTIDFEDNLFDADVAEIASTWNFVNEGYSWIEPHTSLYHETIFTYDYGYAIFGGGLILSSYNSNDLASFGTYEQDLYVYNSKNKDSKKGGGAGGSDTFLIAYGNYEPEVDAELDMRPKIEFSDGRAHVIRGCQVNCTTYFLNIVENGNPYSPALKDGEEIKIYATGYDEAGREGKTVEMTLARKDMLIKQWTKWDLSALGKVKAIKFNIRGGNTDEWGMTTPKYFAIDDIVVEI